jgi:cytochrome c biogenesis protein CcmG, thiol:disulfide interchange protein DsbE
MNSRKLARPVAVALAAGVLLALIWVNRDRFAPLDIGSTAPDYRVYTLEGDSVHLSEFAGDVVLLNIWATWCLPCLREMPALQRLHEALGPDGLRIVAVSVDAPPGMFNALGRLRGEIREYADQFGITFTVLHDPSGDIQSVYQVNGLPTTFIIDRDGRIVRRVMGAVEWDEPPFVDQIRGDMES